MPWPSISVKKKSCNEPIDEKIIASAIILGQCLIDHAKAAFSLIGEDEEATQARIVAEHIQKNGLEEVKPRYIQQMGWAGCSQSEEVYKILKRLELHGILKEVPVEREKSLGRKPGNIFKVNPALKDFPLTEKWVPRWDSVGYVGFIEGEEEINEDINEDINIEEGRVFHEF